MKNNKKSELTTERTQALKMNNAKAKMANKIMTEADDQFNTNNIRNMNFHHNNTNNRYTLSTYENDDATDRLSYLKSIVDKSPKLNLEVYIIIIMN